MVEFLKPVTLLRLAVATSFSCCVVVLYWTTASIGISGRNSDDSLSFGVPHVYYSENSLSERALFRYGNATLALHQAQASNAMSARAGVNGVKATHATAPTVTGRSQNACLVTSYGTDGIGHQLEVRLLQSPWILLTAETALLVGENPGQALVYRCRRGVTWAAVLRPPPHGRGAAWR
ncbi:hypothetical protein THAOC_20558 [Thalassiosira oceanica]|uniref:Uncharacterized protein n=1 Tax=Thalassiosira oceanica TaxID=159749 RepID=K0SE94_THAOC|nr:hypothetical protein THAOC_20558 [Thalassiosira oceanica]|eukprot:EJK59246.1 hypothetical protein THAOC_20558 [Thalassiosira oceanica]